MPKYTLMQHQEDGVKFLESVDGIGALLWEPGVGKTGATAAWLDKLAAKHKEVRVLVVSPLTAADTWVLQPPMFMDSVVKARMLQGATTQLIKQIAASGTWAGVPDTKIQSNHAPPAGIVSGNRVTILSMSAGAISTFCSNRTQTVKVLQAVRKYKPHVVIVDESHIIKSPTANLSKAMYNIGQLAPHRIILTGTVNPNSPLDCYGQWRFLAPWTFSDDYDEPFTAKPLAMTEPQRRSIHPWAYGRFKNRYSIPGGFEGKGISGYQNLDELHDRAAERSMVVLKKDALDLPPTTDVDVHVALTPREQRAYDEMREDLVLLLDSGDLLEAPNALAKMMKLRQITGGFVKDTETGETHVIGDSKRKAMAEVACTTLAGEQRVVMFGHFRSECAYLADLLRKKEPNTRVEIITGSTKGDERLAIRQRFADLKKYPGRIILVAQQRTMSVSVNELVTAQNAVYGCMSERANDWVQSRGRLDRNGQTGQAVTFWNVMVPDSIDSIILDNHKGKGDMEKALLDHIRGVRKP